MATGKTHGRHYRLIVNGVDLSGDSRQLGEASFERQAEDVTAWTDGITNFLFGQTMIQVTGYQAMLNNTATTGAHEALKGQAEATLSLAIGIRAAPAIGDPAFIGTFEQPQYKVQGQGPVLIDADFEKAITDSDHENPFGVMLAVGASLSATTNGASVDNGASSANGLLAHLHITASSGGAWTFKIQDSPDNSAWADLITFSSDGSATAGESGDATGTVDRYLRLQATRTSGTVTAWAAAARQ